ncbi:hypothetical protein BD408DRAFT_434656 [Parasitella parasitica]|nr:hypothetical protein BD408DRAFT_434656 [Parasitella parasitica]
MGPLRNTSIKAYPVQLLCLDGYEASSSAPTSMLKVWSSPAPKGLLERLKGTSMGKTDHRETGEEETKNLPKNLLIGSNTMNVLITFATIIAASGLPELFVGPHSYRIYHG